MGKNGDVCGIRINRLKAYGTAGENRLKVKMGCWRERGVQDRWMDLHQQRPRQRCKRKSKREKQLKDMGKKRQKYPPY